MQLRYLIFRDNRRQQRRLLQDSNWLQNSVAGPANAAAAVAAATGTYGGFKVQDIGFRV